VNHRTIYLAIAFIVALPLVYLLLNGIQTEEKRSFRGREIVTLNAADGSVVVPTKSENKKRIPMLATLKPAFLEKIAGIKPPSPNNLELTINSVVQDIGSCAPEGTTPEGASFDVAVMCAAADFANAKLDKRTALFVDNDARLIVLGDSGKNQARVYHGGMIASYLSPDMTQGERKHEACIVRAALDYLTNTTPDPDKLCTLKTP
jgi:hypothetical protein